MRLHVQLAPRRLKRLREGRYRPLCDSFFQIDQLYHQQVVYDAILGVDDPRPRLD
ncbi:MAG TPA: hypothetical protein VIM98_01905 [Dyella sp.]|uniref:hypothetical protein n=1 Tax=Dyella sp. TaxID=1869338 RepID=UPI002F9502B3